MPALEQAPVSTTAFSTPRGAWVIYRERQDHVSGERYVARKFYIGKLFTFDADEELHADTIEEARALLPPGLINVGRQDGDEFEVIETWC